MGKLRVREIPVTETLDPVFLDRIVGALFPEEKHSVPPSISFRTRDVPAVTVWEVTKDAARITGGRAPGSDGHCTEEGSYSLQPGPICLLDEAGKLLEKFIVSQGSEFIEAKRVLSLSQHGFRAGFSTVGSILEITSVMREYAIETRNFPTYLVNIIKNYLSDCLLLFTERYGCVHKKRVSCGVPQGSVLGPTLRKIAHDSVLRGFSPAGSRVFCYAVETAFLSVGRDMSLAILAAERDLKVLVSDAGMFPPSPVIRFVVCCIRIRRSGKYLGIVVDSRLSFRPHFEALIVKAGGVITLDHLAPQLTDVYAAVREAKNPVPYCTRALLGFIAQRRVIASWKEEELGLVGATFYTTQPMTRHGCFRAYLQRIGKQYFSRCFLCGADADDAEQILIDCPAWMDARSDFVRELEGVLAHPFRDRQGIP
ncbi:hypothetical protein M0804_013325 [Polistes exclamans]|nr:hypothetical protein M0804_013325 [Polistes exclamans]